MAGTLPVGQWSWHERWVYPDQLRDIPDKPWRQGTQSYAPASAGGSQPARTLSGRSQGAHGHTQQFQQSMYQQQGAPDALSQGAQGHTQQQFQQSVYQQQSAPDALSQHLQRTQQQQQQPYYQQYDQTAHSPESAMSAAAASAREKMAALNLAPLVDHGTGGVHLGYQSNNPQAHMHFDVAPSVPRRYRDGTFKRTTSEYCATYRAPADYARELGTSQQLPGGSATARLASEAAPSQLLVPGSRPPVRSRGTKDARAAPPPCRPEQYSFRLWGRINNAHCVTPYVTESQRAYAADSLDDADVLDKSHHLRVERKAYKEALAKAKFQQLIRNK